MTVIVNSDPSGVNASTDLVSVTTAKVMVNGDIIFSIHGDICIYSLYSECYTPNNATASTLQYNVTNNDTATNASCSGVSASLANAPAGTSVLTQLGALTNIPVVSTASGIGAFPWGAVKISRNSDLKTTIGVGSTTGTWRHYLRYRPLEEGAYITAAF
jgi:hypothetical protein